MAARKERLHHTGKSNRTGGITCHTVCTDGGPIDLDNSMRVTMPRKMDYKMDTMVPIAVEGQGNQDFTPKLPGHDFRQPNSNMRESQRLRQEAKETQEMTLRAEADKLPTTLRSKERIGDPEVEVVREVRQKGHKAAPRWNPSRWYQAPSYEQCPLQKDEGETWNHMESHKVQGHIKGKDSLMRTLRRPGSPDSDSGEPGSKHPLQYDNEEYYPGRSQVDGVSQEGGNDFQIRPINLPDFHNPPPQNADSVSRMRRLREVMKQRYAGRPRLMGVFKNCALTKPGFAFPKDLQQVFDQMGIKVDQHECEMLIGAVDKDRKGALTFEEFADLVLGPEVDVGGVPHQAQERHVRHVTKTLVDSLLQNGQNLGRAFCELDPERRYIVSKSQFANAIGTACNHVSKQAVDFLWATQFTGEKGGDHLENRCIDWRDFMSQLAHFAHDNRAPTPICVQGRKRQYDLLQRTAPLTGGYPGDVDLSRPEQNAKDDVQIVADRLVPRVTEMPHKPRDAAMLTEPYVEDIRSKAVRAERGLPARIPQGRLRELLKGREMVHQDELAELLINELDQPMDQAPLAPQVPLYAAQSPDVLTLGPQAHAAANAGGAAAAASSSSPAKMQSPSKQQSLGETGVVATAGRLKLVPADIHSFVATQRVNRDHEIHVDQFLSNLYKPEDEKKVIDRVNDGLNRNLRGHRPPRERPAHEDVPRHENYWQARYIMELLGDNISAVENSNGGKLKSSKVFKRLDMDGDGYITLSDLRGACEKYKVPNSSADLHAFFSELDIDDKGSVDIGEFTRNYQIKQGSLLDNMAKPIQAVYHEGGVQYAGPVQDELDKKEREVADRQAANTAAHEAHHKASLGEAAGSRSCSAPPSAGSARSQMSRTGASIATPGSAIYEAEVGLITGRARVSDVIRARCSQWKPTKTELYTSPARSRFGMTVYPDTRHVTEASMPLSASYMHDSERFKTTNSVHSLFAVPDHRNPQVEDTMRKHAKNEFRVERIRQRQREFTERCWAANEAAQEFDELKIARKALNQLNYERKCRMACA